MSAAQKTVTRRLHAAILEEAVATVMPEGDTRYKRGDCGSASRGWLRRNAGSQTVARDALELSVHS